MGGVFFVKNMKALILTSPLKFSLIPSTYPLEIDTLIVSLRREIDDVILTPSHTFTVGQKLEITITEDLQYFDSNQKYELTITNGGNTIYLGKLQTFKAGTDIQNYEYTEQENKRFDFK